MLITVFRLSVTSFYGCKFYFGPRLGYESSEWSDQKWYQGRDSLGQKLSLQLHKIVPIKRDYN